MGEGGAARGGEKAAPMSVTVFACASWYASNILVILGNKYLLSHSGFERPVFLTLCHMIACVLLSLAASAVMPLKPLKSAAHLGRVSVLAAIFCSTILMGNASLQYLPVSFNQAIGSTTPFFTAVLALAMQGHRENYLTYLALVPVVGGVIIATGGEPAFHLLGFILCLGATAGRALKSVVQAMLMADQSEKLDPMSLLLWMSSVCSVMLIPVVAIMEPQAMSEASALYAKNHNFLWWMVVNAVLAYLCNLLNFLVTKVTSALTLQVLGNAKGVVAAAVSVAVFRNVVTAQGALGYAVTVFGVFLYSTAKQRAKAVDLSLKELAKSLSTRHIVEINGADTGKGVGTHEEATPLLGGAVLATPTATRKAHPSFRPNQQL